MADGENQQEWAKSGKSPESVVNQPAKTKMPRTERGIFLKEPDLLDLGFLVRNMLACDGIELLDLHLFGHVAIVLRGRIKVAVAVGGFQLDLVACAFRYDLLLRLRCVRAGQRAQRRYRSCLSGAGRRSKRAGAPNDSRFQPRNGGRS